MSLAPAKARSSHSSRKRHESAIRLFYIIYVKASKKAIRSLASKHKARYQLFPPCPRLYPPENSPETASSFHFTYNTKSRGVFLKEIGDSDLFYPSLKIVK